MLLARGGEMKEQEVRAIRERIQQLKHEKLAKESELQELIDQRPEIYSKALLGLAGAKEAAELKECIQQLCDDIADYEIAGEWMDAYAENLEKELHDLRLQQRHKESLLADYERAREKYVRVVG
jgi:predicted  nucleic acid-binding Zn-ribbon protein